MGQDMLFPYVVRILVTSAAGVGLFSRMGQCMQTTLFVTFSAGVGLFSWMDQYMLFSNSGECLVSFVAIVGLFILSGLIHANYTFLHIQCSRAFLLCWQISCHICCKSRATFMSAGASICPQTGQTGKFGFQILKS